MARDFLFKGCSWLCSSRRLRQQLTQLRHAAAQQAADSRFGFIQSLGNCGHRPALEMLQLDSCSLILWQLGYRIGELKQLFVSLDALARAGLICRQPAFQPGRGLLQGRFQRAFPSHVPLGTVQSASGIGEIAR
jgi:hypothetical protein